MVKVVIYGITGNAGSNIKKELLSRGHEVVGVARDPSKVEPAENLVVIQGSVDSDIGPIIAGSDVVVNAFAPPYDDVQQLVTFTARLIDASSIGKEHSRTVQKVLQN